MNIHDCFLSTETALHLPFTVHPNLSLHSVVVLEPNAEETVDKLAWRRMKITVNMSLKGNEKSSFGRRTSSDEVDNINSSMYFSDCSSNLEAVSGTSRVKRTLDKTFRRLAWKTWTKLTNIPKIKRKKERSYAFRCELLRSCFPRSWRHLFINSWLGFFQFLRCDYKMLLELRMWYFCNWQMSSLLPHNRINNLTFPW